eukprot:PhF_6_TR26691/c1_g2_i1/m.38902
MICFYAGGICLAALRVWKLFKEWDDIDEEELGWIAKTWNQHLFFNARDAFYHQLEVLFKMKYAKDDISFSKYMRIVIWDAVVVLTDLDYKCWLSLIFAALCNSGRLVFVKDPEMDFESRMLDVCSFVLILGFGPMILLIIITYMLQKRMMAYFSVVKESVVQQQQQLSSSSPHHSPTSLSHEKAPNHVTEDDLSRVTVTIKDKKLWVHAKHLQNINLEETYQLEDPKHYLLFGSVRGSVLALQIPMILSEFYMALLIAGMAYTILMEVGHYRLILVPFSLIPFFTTLFIIQYAILIFAVLSTLGSQIKKDVIRRSRYDYEEPHHHGHGDDDDDDDDEHGGHGHGGHGGAHGHGGHGGAH